MSNHEKHEKTEVATNSLKASLESIRSNLKIAPIMAFLDKFDTFISKKKKFLAKEEVLFQPGENPYFYIVASGALSISRINPTGEKKEVGKVYTGSFLGEWVLSDRLQKDVEAVSAAERTLIVSLTKADLEYLESVDSETLANLYKHINNITSLRLAEAGRELAILYESTEKIQEFRDRWQRGMLDAINHLSSVLSIDGILVIEKHPVVQDLFIYKYNSRFPTVWPMNQKVDPSIKLEEGSYVGPEIMGTKPTDSIFVLPLRSGEKTVGYIVTSRPKNNPISDWDLRVLKHTGPLLASMLEHHQKLADEKARALRNF